MGSYITTLMVNSFLLPTYLCIPIAGVLTMALSLIVGFPCLRLRGPFLAVGTIAILQTVNTIIMIFPRTLGGEFGIALERDFISGLVPNYYVSFIIMLAVTIIIYYIANYIFFYPFVAIREDEVAARAAGINVTKYKLLAFAISAFFAGITGSFYTFYVMASTPETISGGLSFFALVSSTMGGRGTIIGPLIGAFLLTILTESLRVFIYRIRLFIYAIIFLLWASFMPTHGLVALFKKAKNLIKFIYKKR
jgi:branched-chain amino acid transport system permease protein